LYYWWLDFQGEQYSGAVKEAEEVASESKEQSDWIVGQDKGSVPFRYALRLRAPEHEEFPRNSRITAGTLRNETRITECNDRPSS
jgi:hypothetical protein